jgi:hypothetical protein
MAGVLYAVGTPQLIMRNEAEYEELLVSVGSHPERLRPMLHKLKSR